MTELQALETSTDLIDTFQEQWDASHPECHFHCVPAVTRLMRMAAYAERAAGEELARFSLTRGEAEVLFAIVRNPQLDITPKRLQQLMLISSGGLTSRLDRLEKKGLLVRLPDPNDRRGTVLKATQEGEAVTLAAHKAHTEREAKIIEVLSADEKAELAGLLKKLINAQEGALVPDGLK